MKLNKPQATKRPFFLGVILIFCVVIIASLVGCGHSEEGLRFQEMCKEIPKNFNSAGIRKAVLPLFAEYKEHPLLAGSFGILDSDIPKEVKSLPFFSDANWFETSWVGTNKDGLLFATGGADTHWGIVVYQDRNHPDGNGPTYETVPWTNGIYFYSEFR